MRIVNDSKMISSEIRVKLEKYRAELLTFGMQEPSERKSSDWHRFFYKPITELTAFIVNLKGTDKCIEVVCGYASTAFTRFAGCENALFESGVSDEDITIREKYTIYDETDEKSIKLKILDMYERYLQASKDDILSIVKEKRKEFIKQIAIKLKPLGFKKKANTWTRTLEGEYYLMFNAQKSTYSDEYYFNVYIGKNGTNDYGDCYYTRIIPYDMCPMDWQALSNEEFESFLDQMVLPFLNIIIDTPLNALGKNSSYWSGCYCERTKCEFCWMEKNRWDLLEENIYYLPIETPEGIINLEIQHTVMPGGEDDCRVFLSTTVQGVIHSYEADTTEEILLQLAKNLPDKWYIRSCISCRHGNFCPVGNDDNELFCVMDFEPKSPRDLWYVTEDEIERENRRRTLFDYCEQYKEQTMDYFTYSDYYITMHENKN